MSDETYERASSDAPSATEGPSALEFDAGALVERIEDRVRSTVERELGHAMVAITAIRNTLDTVAGTLTRLEERIETLESKPDSQSASMPPRSSSAAIDDDATREILDALVSVAQHLEAVQTATAWAIVSELRLA